MKKGIVGAIFFDEKFWYKITSRIRKKHKKEEGKSLDHDLKSFLKDCSTEREFQFYIRCEECGKIWKSKMVAFSHADKKPLTEGKRIIYETLYRREKADALERAVKEAREIFSCCPICNRLVCDQCFLLCDEIEMCRDCAVRLQENGTPVA